MHRTCRLNGGNRTGREGWVAFIKHAAGFIEPAIGTMTFLFCDRHSSPTGVACTLH
jgi:hypothetical protein